jgi:uncharacterized damage-inducible protein DinB
MAQTAAPTRPRSVASSPKQRFADVYAREHLTTMKVLKAFPESQAAYRPHERSDSALQLAWKFVVENNVAIGALRGPLRMTGEIPPPPANFADVLAAYQASASELKDTLARTPETRFDEVVQFYTGPKQMGDVPVGEVVWFMLLLSVHHRGQLSVYLRCAGGKVPSIYGPSADEPWR